MSLTTNQSSVLYIGNGITKNFAFPFKVWEPSQLRATEADTAGVEQDITGTVTVEISETGGTVTLKEALAEGHRLVIFRSMPFVQEDRYVTGTRFDAHEIEEALDIACAERQELQRQIATAVRVPVTSSETPEDFLQRLLQTDKKASDAADAAAGLRDAACACASAARESAENAATSAGTAETWAKRAEAASTNGPASTEHIGAVKPRKGLTVHEDGTLDVNPGKGLVLDSGENALDVDVSAVNRGVLSVEHGGTGGSTAEDALEQLGLASWQRRMETSTPRRLRQAVLHGREKDGYPAYLVGQEFVNMEHEDGVYHSRRGTVSVSGEYNATYRGTKPLRNQVVFQNHAWLTQNTVTSGWWQYDFADGPHVLTGLFLLGRDNEPATTPFAWQLLGWNDETADWEEIYRRDADQSLRGSANNLKAYGRMHWFTDNTKAYQRVRINIDSNHGGNFSQISVIRFYEAVIPGLDKYDVALYASPEETFVATVGGGLAAETADRVWDIPCRLTAPVIFDGHKLHEMSRNYLYLVPATDDGSLPASLAGDHAQAFTDANGRKFFLYADTRKLHYGTQGDLENECFALLQSRHNVAYDPVPSGFFEHNMGALEYPLEFTNMRISLAEAHRGAPSSYQFSAGANNWISPNKDLSASGFPEKRMHTYTQECTVELDFKWEGPAPETADGQYILYDAGCYGALGWVVAYHNRKKCLALFWDNAWRYWVPFNAEDKAWHTLAVSLRAGHIYVHVDGMCLGMFDDAKMTRANYNYWMLGRWISSNSAPWYGYINNLRVTHGTALYQGAEYTVPERFYTTRIPDKSLWYDSAEGVVKEYDAAGERWHSLPMLPIGHVDTGRREHLMTDQPRGTFHLQQSKYLLNDGYDTDGQYNASHAPVSLFNFGHGGTNPWATVSNAAADHYVQFTLEHPMSFDTLRLCHTSWDWRAFPCIFRFLGRNPEDIDIVELPPDDEDGEATTREVPRWTTLIDRSVFIDDGGSVNESPQPNGDTHHLGGYKDIPVANSNAFSIYRLELPAKTAVPFYKDYGHTAVRLMPVFRDARPEVLNISSYAIGDTWSIGPIPLTVNTEAEIPVPFANLAFDVTGWVEEAFDFQRKRRQLGTLEGNVPDVGYCGETLYQATDAVIIITGKKYLSIYNGTWWNASAVNEASTNADYYLICTRRI